MLIKLFKMRNRYLDFHLSSSRGRIAKSFKISFFPLIFISSIILLTLSALIVFSIFYFKSIDDVTKEIEYNKEIRENVDNYIKDKLGELKTNINFANPIKHEEAIMSQGIKDGHSGIDIVTELGDNVFASATGKVLYSGSDSIYGNIIILSHQNNFYTFYGHLDTILVKPHDFVKSGDIIGLAGESGIAKGPHLHFEIWGEDGMKDPLEMGVQIEDVNNYKDEDAQK